MNDIRDLISIQQMADIRRRLKRAKKHRRPGGHASAEARDLREIIFNRNQRRFLTLLADISNPLYEKYWNQLGDKFRKLKNLK